MDREIDRGRQMDRMIHRDRQMDREKDIQNEGERDGYREIHIHIDR